MSNDTTVTLFSQSCLAQRDQPQSKLNSISSGLGVTLVRANNFFSPSYSDLLASLSGHLLCLQLRSQCLSILDLEACRRIVEITFLATLRLVHVSRIFR